jgi:hypothetical protein
MLSHAEGVTETALSSFVNLSAEIRTWQRWVLNSMPRKQILVSLP